MKFRAHYALIVYSIVGLCCFFVAGSLAEARSAIYAIFFSFFILSGFCFYLLSKRQERNLLLSQADYRNVFEKNPNPMWIYETSSYRFMDVNSAAIDTYGYSREEFLQMSVLDIRPPGEASAVKDFIDEIKAGKRNSGRWLHMKKNGDRFYASINSHSMAFADKECALVLAMDVTQEVLQEKRIEESYRKEIELNEALATHIDLIKQSNEANKRFSDIINTISNMVTILDKEGKIVWANKAFVNTTGFSLKEAAGRRLIELLAGPKTDRGLIYEAAAAAREGVAAPSIEIINYAKDGGEYWVEMTLTPVFDQSGTFDGLISVENVITERKERERKISEQNQALRHIAWVSSHEVRRPVSSILSLVTLLKSMEQKAETDECLELLEVCSAELDDIVKGIARKVNLTEL